MKNEKTTDEKKVEVKDQPELKREIIIKTDGNSINIEKADVAGNIELVGILQTIINSLSKK